jgi:predicted ATP-grasp superfamily ATP-dependent carboligase
MYVLITDAFIRKAFDIINILQRRHPEVHLILASDKPNGMGAKVLYGEPVLALPKDSDEAFEQGLLSIQQRYEGHDIVYMPVEEDTTKLFYRFIARNSNHRFLYRLPSEADFLLAGDKMQLGEFCSRNNIPVPKIFTKADLPTLRKDFRKLIVKPKRGSGAKGIIFIDEAAQLDVLETLDEETFFVQELIPNSSAVQGGFFLFNEGKLTGYYSHERLRTYPARGGVTVFSKAIINPAIQELGADLLGRLNWSGVAMIEYLYDEVSDTYKLIEINPRLWGSVMLSEFAGANFLINYIRLCTNEPLEPGVVKENVYIRWLLPFDLLGYVRSRFSIKGFWKNPGPTCYINRTYTSLTKSVFFNLMSVFDLKKLKKLVQSKKG